MREFFIQNETIILFAQGLVFFALGFAVWLQRRRATRLVLSSSLIWLAAFAFVEALAIWGHVFVPIQERYAPELAEALIALRALLQTAAFLFLLQFGIRLLDPRASLRNWLTALSATAWVGILLVGTLAAESRGWGPMEWEAAVSAAARYGLLVPGAVLAAIGLWRQRGELAEAGMTAIKPYALAAAAVLALYALFAGLIVDAGPWSPPGLGNDAGWFAATGLPLEVLRGTAGLALCVAAVKLLEIFDVEAKQRLEATDRARAVAEERARFRRDLHDGTIQSIYAAGLHLETLAIRCDDPAVSGEVRQVVADLNEVTDGIRQYIRALAALPPTPAGLADGLAALTHRFAVETGRDVRFRVQGATSGALPDEAGQHLEQILREALANSARHAGACRVSVDLVFADDELDLVIRDNGCGIAGERGHEGAGQGLRNMRERARRLGGRLEVVGEPQRGTRIALAVPLDSEEPEPQQPGIRLDGRPAEPAPVGPDGYASGPRPEEVRP